MEYQDWIKMYASLKESAWAGIQDLEEFVDTAEAGVLAKMAELRQIELTERDKKIAVMAAAAAAGLIVSSIIFAKRLKRKKRRAQEAAQAAAESEADALESAAEEERQ